MTEGYVQLSRRFFGNFLWIEERVYSRAEAWLDCIQMAAFRNTKRMIGNDLIEIPRGGIVASERFLSDRWMWSRTKVRAFLDMLEKDRMIDRQKDQGISVVLLCNYEQYNAGKEPVKKPEEEPRKDQTETKVEERKEGESIPPNPQGGNEGGKKPKQEKLPVTFNIPPGLDTAAFREVWEQWVAHRREIKKPVTQQAADQQLRKCAEWGEARAIEAIKNSIRNSYQGLFEARSSNAGNQRPPQNRNAGTANASVAHLYGED